VFVHPDGAITVELRDDGDAVAVMTMSPRGDAHLYHADRPIDRPARIDSPKVRIALDAVKQWIEDGRPPTASPADRVVEALGRSFLNK
jgi:hypothetical protein